MECVVEGEAADQRRVRIRWIERESEVVKRRRRIRGLEKRLCQTKSFGHTIKEEKRKNGVLNEKEAV